MVTTRAIYKGILLCSGGSNCAVGKRNVIRNETPIMYSSCENCMSAVKCMSAAFSGASKCALTGFRSIQDSDSQAS